MGKYTVRSVEYHANVIAECETLLEAIGVKTLQVVRYGFAVSIFDEREYLVPQKAQLDHLEGIAIIRKPQGRF